MASLIELLKKQKEAKAATPQTTATNHQEAAASPFAGLKLNKKELTSIASNEKAAEKQSVKLATVSLPGGHISRLAELVAKNKNPSAFPAVDIQETVEVPSLDLSKIIAPQLSSELKADPDQEAAVEGMLREKYCCLIGAAGTGKTTTLKKFLARLVPTLKMQKRTKQNKETGEVIETYNLPIVFCAYTGRAVEQMKRALPAEYHSSCGTIHGDKVLAYQPEYYDDFIEGTDRMVTRMRFVPYHTESNRMPYLYYIVDEAGMCSVELWNIFHAAMLNEARVILLGDINQLPPVYGRSILGYAMTKWPVFELRTVHRQAEGNPIIANAHRILEGKLPNRVAKLFDIVDLGDKGSNSSQQTLLSAVKKLHSQGDFSFATDAIIVPQNVGNLGQITLNEYLGPMANPGVRSQAIKTGIALVHFAVGDKVMMTANDKESGLTNGQVGFVKNIALNGNYKNKGAGKHSQLALETAAEIELDDSDDFDLTLTELAAEAGFEEEEEESLNQRQASHIVEVDFNGRLVAFSTAGEFRKLAPAYAITCHKSQGGEYPVVVILMHSANGKMLSREWFYTAVTRARERVVLVCNMRGLNMALSSQRIKGKTLAEKTKAYLKFGEEAVRTGAELPNLPEPLKIEEV